MDLSSKMITRQESGGFLQPTVPSPGSSTVSSPSAISSLPRPRSHPLKPGGAKESSVIDYVDQKLLSISRRYEKRFHASMEEDGSPSHVEDGGYEEFGSIAKDLESLADVIWLSGTRWFPHNF